MSSRKPKAYGYVRVSTDQQAERGMGVEIQCDAIDAWARANGFPDGVEEFVYEIGVSGAAPFHERVGIATVLSLLRKGDVLVVARTDRLARDLVAQEMFLGHAWAKGATVASCVETEAAVLRPDDPGDPARKLIRQVLGAVSEYERALIRLRLQAGIKRRKAAEGWAGGSVGIEYRHDPATRSRVMTEEGKRYREWVAEHEKDGLSARDFAAAFNEEFGTNYGYVTIWRLRKRMHDDETRARLSARGSATSPA